MMMKKEMYRCIIFTFLFFLVSCQQSEQTPTSGWTSYQGAKTVADMVFDDEGNLWAAGVIGAYQGVFQLDPHNQNQEVKSVEQPFKYKIISSIALAEDGSLWIGTKGSGVAKFDGEIWTTYTVDDGLSDNYVQSIAATSDGAVWIGTFENDGGVSRYDGDTWITYSEEDDNIWFGTYRSGVSFYDSDNWITYSEDDGLVQNWINSVTTAPDGTLWVSTLDKGVSSFDGSNWVTYTESDGLISNYINSIAIAPDGSIWFASDIGVSSFDGATWTTYTKEDGLIDNKVGSIIVGPEGALWFGTNNGISRYVLP